MACTQLFLSVILWVMPIIESMVVPTNSTISPVPAAIGAAADPEFSDLLSISIPRSRRKRYISSRDMSSLLDYHNRVRSQVFPPAANMEYMVRVMCCTHWCRACNTRQQVKMTFTLISLRCTLAFSPGLFQKC